jgi:hypothetical protein
MFSINGPSDWPKSPRYITAVFVGKDVGFAMRVVPLPPPGAEPPPVTTEPKGITHCAEVVKVEPVAKYR